jgi:glutamate formiminotransferase / 5-formyltetrahydrofolate cyclo-ligase
LLLAVPNFSEGRDLDAVAEIVAAFTQDASELDRHSDAVHNRSVLTLSGVPGGLTEALARGALACVERIDMRSHHGAHPCIGALDVCPVVWLREEERDAARGEALAAARRLADGVALPVFLYGELASETSRRERAFFREGGLAALTGRMARGDLHPDLGPPAPHPTAGATLVTARPPLAAFNVELAGTDLTGARAIAAGVRESGGGLAGVRAIGIDLGGGRTQISTNVHDPVRVPLAKVIESVEAATGGLGARVAAAEIVGLVPESALAGMPADLPLPGFDPDGQVIERRIRV